ncbi:hypothetical protein H5410_014987 [Solanum commersonii]|uniref:Uncharacterized protein n=1 Tax=Solanum commersonii TaxID=4109 RepID=A0A9J5ZST5_SOLCO|nr:hypothetical protein H5410_014987 [Solanum commersonii]
MSTLSLGHQFGGLGFATSLSGKPKTHGWFVFAKEWRRPTFNLGKMKSFFLQVSQKKSHQHERISQNTSKNSVGGSFGEVIRNVQLTWRFALWGDSSPSCTSLQHGHALASRTGTKGRVHPFGESLGVIGDAQASASLLFSASLFILRLSVHASTKTSNT